MTRQRKKHPGIITKDGQMYLGIKLDGIDTTFRIDNISQGNALRGRLKAGHREGKHFKKEKSLPFCQIATDYEKNIDIHRRGKKGDDRARVQWWMEKFGNQDARTLTISQIQQGVNALIKAEKMPATVDRYLTVLKAILNHADGLETLLADIRKKVKKPKCDNELVRDLPTDKEPDLLERLPQKYRPVVLTAIYAGGRQGELFKLQWKDVDWNRGILIFRETKAGDTRRIPMNSIVQSTLAEMKGNTTPNPDNKIFPFDPRNFRRAFSQAVKEAGLAPFRFHDLRHTFASRLAMKGHNDRTIMALGGWKSPAMLKRYAHLSPTHLYSAMESITSFQSGSKSGSGQEAGTTKDSQPLDINGEPRAARTHDPRLKRAMLYQLS